MKIFSSPIRFLVHALLLSTFTSSSLQRMRSKSKGRCGTKPRHNATATLVVVQGCTGSTWLAEALESHPCVHSFTPSDLVEVGADHHTKIRDHKVLMTTLTAMKKRSNGKSFGVLVQDGYGDSGLKSILNSLKEYHVLKKKEGMGGGFGLGETPLRVLLFEREPLFASICALKKQRLAKLARSNSSVQCSNVHHQGRNCPAARGLQIDPSFQELHREVERRMQHTKDVAARASQVTRLFRKLQPCPAKEKMLFKMNYAELVCAKRMADPQHSDGSWLPARAQEFLGISSQHCGRAESGGLVGAHEKHFSVKMSPPNPAAALSNLVSISKEADERRAAWGDALRRETEATDCDALR